MSTASSSRARLIEHAAALIAIFALALLGYGFLLAPGRAPYSPFSDFIPLGLSSKTVLYDSLHSGRGLPFWRSDMFSGLAAMTDPQNAYACPLNFPFWLWPPLRALGPAMWLCFLAAGLVGYAVGSALEIGFWARLLMAAAFMFDFKQACYLELFPGSQWIGAILVPLLYAAVWRAAERPGRRPALGIGLAGALCLQSGQLQLTYYSAFFLAAFSVWRWAALIRSGKTGQARSLLACLAGGSFLAAGLSAFVLVPLSAEASLISRGQGAFDFFLSGHAAGPRALLGFFAPRDGYPEFWEDAAYFGLGPLVLAAAGVALTWRRLLTRQLSAAFVAAAALATCEPLQKLLFRFLPGFELFRLPGRFFFLAGWFGIALAGLGLDDILRRMRGAGWRKMAAPASAALVALIGFEGSVHARRHLSLVAQERLSPSAGYAEFLQKQAGDFRVVPVGRRAVNFGWAAPMGLQLAAGFGSYNYAHYQTYCDLLRWNKSRPQGARVWTDFVSISRPDLLDALGAKFLVAPSPLELPRGRFALAAHLTDQPVFELYRGLSQGEAYIYENASALPRVFFVDKVIPAYGPGEALAAVQAESLRGAAVVEAQDGGLVAGPSRGDKVELAGHGAGWLDVELKTDQNRYLVISEVWNPGWKAKLDGRDLPLYRTDLALMGAWVPAGEHKLSLSFRPAGWGAGLTLTALSAALCAIL